MKRFLLLLFLAGPIFAATQITTPIIKARFGVDGDLRANYFNGLVQTGNDDWFNMVATDTSGKSVIDTTGSAAIVAGYLADVSPWPKRMSSFYRTMNRPSYSIVNNRLWLDALFVRDYHGNDTTVFTSGADKNGMSPAFWSGGIQSIPDKNDILDMFMHVRRAGPNPTDSLWMFGGISLDNTTGDRYFDFEMYQTDINYDRVSHRWYGYGPDAGHTSWTFDAAGNILTPGDIIFSAQYQSSTLTNIEARIWVSSTTWQTVIPVAFNWSGQFDGAGSGATFGYASILPKTVGAFYTGLGSVANTWAGPFRVVLQNNSLATTYLKDQFMEFSVNLTKLGLDPANLLGGDVCGTPFNRMVVKTRASASFTAELKDFIAPTDLFLAPRVHVATQTPYICDTGSIAQIYVTNPLATSTYQWSTTNGHIVGPTTGTSIFVDTPGVYIVKQYLQVGCSVYASDTIQIYRLVGCVVLDKNLIDFNGAVAGSTVRLDWKVLNNYVVNYFDVERSTDGIHFTTVGRVEAQSSHDAVAYYSYIDPVGDLAGQSIFYRIRLQENGTAYQYSPVIKLSLKTAGVTSVVIYPVPARDILQLEVNAATDNGVQVYIYDFNGQLVRSLKRTVHKGFNQISLDDLVQKPAGVYTAVILVGDDIFNQKIMLVR